VGAREQTIRGWRCRERHGVDEIQCGELRREPHNRAREKGCLLDKGEEGLGSESREGRAEPIRRDEGGGSNDRKTSAQYVSGLSEFWSVGAAEVILVEFRIRNGFREWLVTGLKERGYGAKKAGKGVYREGWPRGGMVWPQDVRKRVAWERVHWERMDEEAGRWGWSIRPVAAQWGSNASGRKRAASNASGC